MNPFRLLSVATGLGLCMYTNMPKWNHNFLTVRAQPRGIKRRFLEPESGSDEELSPQLCKRVERWVSIEDLFAPLEQDSDSDEEMKTEEDEEEEDEEEEEEEEEEPAPVPEPPPVQIPTRTFYGAAPQMSLRERNKRLQAFRAARALQQQTAKEVLTWKPYKEEGGVIFPHPSSKRQILEYKDFVVCYDNETKAPCWVLEEIITETFDPSREKQDLIPPAAREDFRVAKEFLIGICDFVPAIMKIKFQHVAAFDIHPDYMDPCVITNIVAQRIKAEDPKAKTIWDELRSYTTALKSMYYRIYILSGPLYIPQRQEDGKMIVKYELIEGKHVPIPTHFFKVFLCENSDSTFQFECYKFPNTDTLQTPDIRKYNVSKEELEGDAGFKIFDKVPHKKIADTRTNRHYAIRRYCTPRKLSFGI